MADYGLEKWELDPAFPRIEEALLELCGDFREQPLYSRFDKALGMLTEERFADVDLSVASALGHRALVSDIRTSRRHFTRPGRIQLRRDIVCRIDYPRTLEEVAFLSEANTNKERAKNDVGTVLAERPETGYVEYSLGSIVFEEVSVARDGVIILGEQGIGVSGLAGVLETVIQDSQN